MSSASWRAESLSVRSRCSRSTVSPLWAISSCSCVRRPSSPYKPPERSEVPGPPGRRREVPPVAPSGPPVSGPRAGKGQKPHGSCAVAISGLVLSAWSASTSQTLRASAGSRADQPRSQAPRLMRSFTDWTVRWNVSATSSARYTRCSGNAAGSGTLPTLVINHVQRVDDSQHRQGRPSKPAMTAQYRNVWPLQIAMIRNHRRPHPARRV